MLKYILMIGGGYLLYNAALATKTEFTPLNYRISFNSGKAILYVVTRIQNNSALSYTISKINLRVFLVEGNILLGTINPAAEIVVHEKSNTTTEFPLILKGTSIIEAVGQNFKLGRKIRIVGDLFVSGVRQQIDKVITVV